MKIKYSVIFFVIIFGFKSVVSQTDPAEILLNGTVSVENNQIKNISDPTDENDAVNKGYLDQLINFLQSQISELQEIILNDIDNDGDGFSENQGDCDDNNASINPNAPENCDGIDNNCDGNIDENAIEDMGLFCAECVDGQIITTSGNPCDDGNACTTDDVCNQGVCVGTAFVCDDGNSCTDDACDPSGVCIFTPNNNACEDGDACTTGDVCVNGACVGGIDISCDDNIPCTIDVCDPVQGCMNIPDNTSCDDGDISNGIEYCDPQEGCVVGG